MMKKIWMIALCLLVLCGCQWGGASNTQPDSGQSDPEGLVINDHTRSGLVTEITDVSILVETQGQNLEYMLNDEANKVMEHYNIKVGTEVVIEYHEGKNGVFEIDTLGVAR